MTTKRQGVLVRRVWVWVWAVRYITVMGSGGYLVWSGSVHCVRAGREIAFIIFFAS